MTGASPALQLASATKYPVGQEGRIEPRKVRVTGAAVVTPDGPGGPGGPVGPGGPAGPGAPSMPRGPPGPAGPSAPRAPAGPAGPVSVTELGCTVTTSESDVRPDDPLAVKVSSWNPTGSVTN